MIIYAPSEEDHASYPVRTALYRCCAGIGADAAESQNVPRRPGAAGARRRPARHVRAARPEGGDPVHREFRRAEERDLHLQRSEEHTSELQSPDHLVCRLLLEKKKKQKHTANTTERYSEK